MTEIVTVLSSDVSILSSIAVSRLMPTYVEELSGEGCKFLVSVPTEDTDTGHISKYVNYEQIENSLRSRLGVDDILYDIKELSANKSDNRYKELGDRGGDFVCETEIQPYIISAICESANGNILSVRGYRLSTAIEEELQNTMHKQISVLNIYSPTIADGTSVNNKIVNQLCVENLVKAGSISHIGQYCDVMYTTPSGPLKQSILNQTIYVCETDDEIQRCANANMTFSDVWNGFKIGANMYSGGTWYWYGRTPGYPEDYDDGGERSGVKTWSYSQSDDTVVQKSNARDFCFLTSPNAFSNYEFEIRAYSTDGDDDFIGIILAYVDDDTTDTPRYLAAVRTPNYTNVDRHKRNHWFVADSRGAFINDSDEAASRIAINNPDDYAGGWGKCGAGTCIKAVRKGSKIELWTKPFVADQSRKSLLGTEYTNKIELDLATIKGGTFNRPAKIGYLSYSQPQTKYENLTFSVEKTVVDTRTNSLSVYDPIEKSWKLVSVGLDTLSACGYGRLVKNTLTEKTFYVTQTGFERVVATGGNAGDISTLKNAVEGLSSLVKELENKNVDFDKIYPVGSIYISTTPKIPDSFKGTWIRLALGRALWNTENDNQLGTELKGIFPKHSHGYTSPKWVDSEDCYTTTKETNCLKDKDATTSSTTIDSSISTIVDVGSGFRTPSIGVAMWKRTS